MKLYVIGPVTGIEDDNRPAFEVARDALEEAGYEVEIPHDTIPTSAEWHEAMVMSIKAMMRCDGVCAISGWRKSLGAEFEHYLAGVVRLPAKPLDEWLMGVDERPLLSCNRRSTIDNKSDDL